MADPSMIPDWFAIPAAIALNAWMIRAYVSWHAGRMREIRAEATTDEVT